MASVGREPEGTPKAIPGTVSNPSALGNPVDPPIPNTISSSKKVGNAPIPGTVSGPKAG
jgi:hypothetical protein